MRKALTILAICLHCLFTLTLKGQSKDAGVESMVKFYDNNSPLEFLQLLKIDFKDKDQLNIFCMTSSPDNWVKEEHIAGLMKLIYSSDSTEAIVHVLSSYLATGKFSSIGREAQNLITSFRTKEHYPPLWSFGPPDRQQGMG